MMIPNMTNCGIFVPNQHELESPWTWGYRRLSPLSTLASNLAIVITIRNKDRLNLHLQIPMRIAHVF